MKFILPLALLFSLVISCASKKPETVVLAPANMKDADKDGVADGDDQCPTTPTGDKANAYGCSSNERLEFTLNVKFETGSSKIDQKFTDDLKKLSDFMIKYPNSVANIEGHTDNTGSEKLNYKISQKRANVVRNYLIKTYKIDKTRLTAKGYGPLQPVADNSTQAGRDKNRRVVAHVTSE